MSAAQVEAAQCHGLGYLLQFFSKNIPQSTCCHFRLDAEAVPHLPLALQRVSDTIYGAEISTLWGTSKAG